MRTGRVQTRSKPSIAIWKRVFREAGINISRANTERMLCSTHIRRSPEDARRMDLICPGIDGVFAGAPLFMDVTIVSPLRGTGIPMPNAATCDGAAVAKAAKDCAVKDYPDVEASSQAQLLSLGTETYGRWSKQCITLVRQLAKYRAKNMPEYLQRSIEAASFARWWNLLSVTMQRIVCEAILRPSGGDLHEAADSLQDPNLTDLLDLAH